MIEDRSEKYEKYEKYALIKDDGVKISVAITGDQEVQIALVFHTVYHIEIKYSNSDIVQNISRRYSEFDTLRSVLVQNWPGCFVPPLPPKKVINKMDKSFIAQRKRQLELFLLKLATLKHLWDSNQFQIFLKSSQVNKDLKNLPEQTSEQLQVKYEQKFNKLKGLQINQGVITKIKKFLGYITKTLPMVSNFKQLIKKFLDLRSKNLNEFKTFITFLMPDYEKHCLSEYVNAAQDKYIFSQNNDKTLIQNLTNLKQFINKPEFRGLYLILEEEELQILGFIQLFKCRAVYENKLEEYQSKEKQLNMEEQKLMAGKLNIFQSIFKNDRESNKKDIQTQRQSMQTKKQKYQFICDISSIILGYYEIDRFKVQKFSKYFQTLKRISEYEKEFALLKIEFFENLLKNHNFTIPV